MRKQGIVQNWREEKAQLCRVKILFFPYVSGRAVNIFRGQIHLQKLSTAVWIRGMKSLIRETCWNLEGQSCAMKTMPLFKMHADLVPGTLLFQCKAEEKRFIPGRGFALLYQQHLVRGSFIALSRLRMNGLALSKHENWRTTGNS